MFYYKIIILDGRKEYYLDEDHTTWIEHRRSDLRLSIVFIKDIENIKHKKHWDYYSVTF